METVASIIIPNHNKYNALINTLSSLQMQQGKAHFEVIVVDDHSFENPIQSTSRIDYDRFEITYIRRDEGVGNVAAARNLGAKTAQSPILIFLDADICVTPNFVDEHIRLHTSIQTPVATVGPVLGYWGPRPAQSDIEIKFKQIMPDNWMKIVSSPRAFSLPPDMRTSIFRHFEGLLNLPAPWVLYWTGNASVNRHAFESVGGFDERLINAREDTELGYRLHLTGVQFMVSSHAYGIHQPHDYPTTRLGHSLQNRVLFFEKHQSIEAELQIPVQNILLNQVIIELEQLARHQLTTNYDTIDDEFLIGLGKKDESEKNLCIGFGDIKNLQLFVGDIGIDINPSTINIGQSLFPDKKFHKLVGIRTPYNDLELTNVIVTDFWRCLNEVCLKALVREVARVGKNVFFLYSPQFNPFLGTDVSWSTIDRIHNVCTELQLSLSKISIPQSQTQVWSCHTKLL